MHVVASGSLLRYSWGKEGREKIVPPEAWHKQIGQATESNFTQNEMQWKHGETEESNFCSIIKIGLFLWQNDNNFKITSLSTAVNSVHEIQETKYFCSYSVHIENFFHVPHLNPGNCFIHQYPHVEFPAFLFSWQGCFVINYWGSGKGTLASKCKTSAMSCLYCTPCWGPEARAKGLLD